MGQECADIYRGHDEGVPASTEGLHAGGAGQAHTACAPGGARCHLQISDFALDWPSRAQWLPKCTSWKTPGKCSSTQASVGC